MKDMIYSEVKRGEVVKKLSKYLDFGGISENSLGDT